MDIDGQEAERFDIRLAPNPAATIEQEALDVAGVTLEQVQSYQPMEEGYRQLVGILSKYVNKFDKRDKMYLVGYNNAGFDNNFLRALFQQCGDKYFGSWFYPNCMDVYVMVTPFLMGVRNDMENFKLMTVARTMGIDIDENKLHDATYDIELTRDIFTGGDLKLMNNPRDAKKEYVIHMSNILKGNCDIIKGRKLYVAFKKAINGGKKIVIKFDTDQPISMSTRVMNPSFGEIMDEYGKDIFQGNLKL